jgi:hypothetical protein
VSNSLSGTGTGQFCSSGEQKVRLVAALSVKSACTRSMQVKQLHRGAVNPSAPFRFVQESATASVFSLPTLSSLSYLVSAALSQRAFVVVIATAPRKPW